MFNWVISYNPKLQVTIFKTIASHLKFSYTIREPLICCSFGAYAKNTMENATGQAAEASYGLSDVSFSQLFYTSQKVALHDMTSPYDNDHICFMVSGRGVLLNQLAHIATLLTAPSPSAFATLDVTLRPTESVGLADGPGDHRQCCVLHGTLQQIAPES